MIKKMICIECPKGCTLSVDIENCQTKSVTGASCPRGVAYATAEAQDPVRLFTANVLTRGMNLKLLPVRTNKPIPKREIFRAVEAIGKIVVDKPVKTGDIIDGNFLGLGVKLLATRELGDKI